MCVLSGFIFKMLNSWREIVYFMVEIKPMRLGDFEFATKLANTMNWNMAPEDFEFAMWLEPAGCFVAFQGSMRVGIATCISYGSVGWFGNLIVEQKCRKQGVGSLLVKHAVSYLQSKGVKTIGLYAYPNLIGFYGSLGFEKDKDFLLLNAQSVNSSAEQALPSVGASVIQSIEAFDQRCFGGDRKKLLESIILEKGNLSYYKPDGSGVEGYVAATVYEKMAWVGPLLCQNHNVDAATLLLKTVLSKLNGRDVYTVVPKKETALSIMLFNAGFKEDFYVTRMFLGKPVAKNCINIPESLERG